MNYKSLLLSVSVLISGNSSAYNDSSVAWVLQELTITVPPTAQDVQTHRDTLYNQAHNAIKIKPFAEQDLMNLSYAPFVGMFAGALTGAILADDDHMRVVAALVGSLASLLITIPIENSRIDTARPLYERALAQAEAEKAEKVKIYYEELLATKTHVPSHFNNLITRSLNSVKALGHEQIVAFTTRYTDTNTLVSSVSLPFSTFNFPLLTATGTMHQLINNLTALQNTFLNIIQTHDSLPCSTRRHIKDTLLPLLKDILNTVQANVLSIKQTSTFQIEELRKQEADLLRKKQEQLETAQRLAEEQIELARQQAYAARQQAYAAQQQTYAAQQEARKNREAYLIARQNQRAAHGQANGWADVADRVLTN